MFNWKYTVGVSIVTVIIMAVGGVLWNSESSELKPAKTAPPQPDTISAVVGKTTTPPPQTISVPTPTPSPTIIPTETTPVVTAEPTPAPEPDPFSANHTPGVWERGTPDAPVTIESFPDFGCHICVEKELLILQALKDYPGKIHIVYHHYSSPGFDEKLAEALEAAGAQGKFWELHDRLIYNVPDSMPALLVIAQSLGLDMRLFSEALDSGQYTDVVRKSKEDAVVRDVKSVSTFINGIKYKKSPGTAEDLHQAIDEALAKVESP